MKLTNDVMNVLGIKTVVLSTKLGDVPCVITDITSNIWVCFTTISLEDNYILFRVKTDEGFVRFQGKIAKIVKSNKPGLNIFIVRVFPDGFTAKQLLSKLQDIENKKDKWNRRSEERWPVGNELLRIRALGLQSSLQSIYINNHAYQCCIKDVSFHGLGLIVFSAPIRIEDNLYMRLSFENPTGCIHVAGNVVSICRQERNKVLVSTAGLSIKNNSMPYMGRIALYNTKIERFA